MCLYPKLIRNPKYKATKKNGGVVPKLEDERVAYAPIGCGECMECRKKKANEWRIRLMEEIKVNKNGKFITLTFSNEQYRELAKKCKGEGYNLENEIAVLAVRRFLERWRKEKKKSVRHWLITELGHNGTERIHLHGIIFTDNVNDVEKHWQYGWVWKGKMVNEQMINYVNEKTINYIIKYCTKIDFEHRYYKAKILCSSGIGGEYKNTHNFKRNVYKEGETDESYKTRGGYKMGMPIYYRNMAFNEKEREKLWIEKLDKNIRYVLGRKIDISKGEEEYYKALEYAQKKNKELGYGDGEKNWEQYTYEQERRLIKQKEIIKKKERKALRGSFQKDLDINKN